jgi:hypothetical protein
MNYSELQTAVQDAVENSFSNTDFATMTKLAEQRIYNSVQLPNLRKTSNLTLSVGNPLLAVPSDFLSAFSFGVTVSNEFSFLLNKDVNFIREAFPNASTTGTPKYYALYGTQTGTPKVQSFILGPTPGAALTAELNYFYYPESIVTAGTTWLGDNFDSVLFNAVMVEAARWMKQEQDIMAMMDQQYVQSLTLLKNLGDGKDRQDGRPRSQYRHAQVGALHKFCQPISHDDGLHHHR